MGGTHRRASFAGLGLSPSPPVPTALTFLTGPIRARIDFDKPLQTGARDASKWNTYRSSLHWTGESVESFTDYVIVTKATDEFTILSDRVIYDDSGSDLKGLDGTPVASFTVYP